MASDPCFSNQHRILEGRRETNDVILVRANLIRPRPRTEISTRIEAIKPTIPENGAGSRPNQGRNRQGEVHN
jgi:hypothetical protein